MKIKGFMCLGLIFLLVFLIHLKTEDHDIYYLNLSIDKSGYSYEFKVKEYLEKKGKLEKFVSNFTTVDDRVTDLIMTIEDNKSVTINEKKQTIKNALIKADLVTVFIGLNDINYKIGYSDIDELYDYADSFLEDLETLLILLREYCKEEIIFIGYYNSYGNYYDQYFEYINKEVKKKVIEYDIDYVNISDVYKVNNYSNSVWLTESEHKVLSDRIKKIIDDKILK